MRNAGPLRDKGNGVSLPFLFAYSLMLVALGCLSGSALASTQPVSPGILPGLLLGWGTILLHTSLAVVILILYRRRATPFFAKIEDRMDRFVLLAYLMIVNVFVLCAVLWRFCGSPHMLAKYSFASAFLAAEPLSLRRRSQLFLIAALVLVPSGILTTGFILSRKRTLRLVFIVLSLTPPFLLGALLLSAEPLLLVGSVFILPFKLWTLLYAAATGATHSGEAWSTNVMVSVWGLLGLWEALWAIVLFVELRKPATGLGSDGDR